MYVIHAVHGKPPSMATGRVGAVGQIHFICTCQLDLEILAQKQTN